MANLRLDRDEAMHDSGYALRRIHVLRGLVNKVGDAAQRQEPRPRRVGPTVFRPARPASIRDKSANTHTITKMPLSGNMILPLDEVVGEQRRLEPDLQRRAGVLSALPD
jgi:hypothetical protein